METEMVFVLFLLVPVMAAYAIGQTRVFLRLVGLVRQPGEIIESALADKCVIHMVITPPRLYGRGSAFVPIALMAQICLIYAAGTAWVKAYEVTRGWRSWPTGGFWSLDQWATAIFTFYVPAAPLAGLVLLIVHVLRVRAAKTWETPAAAGKDEMP